MLSTMEQTPISRILDTRIGADGSLYYQVKWKKSWVKEENVLLYPNLIEMFWKFIEKNTSACELKRDCGDTILTSANSSVPDLKYTNEAYSSYKDLDIQSLETAVDLSNIVNTDLSDNQVDADNDTTTNFTKDLNTVSTLDCAPVSMILSERHSVEHTASSIRGVATADNSTNCTSFIVKEEESEMEKQSLNSEEIHISFFDEENNFSQRQNFTRSLEDNVAHDLYCTGDSEILCAGPVEQVS